MKIKENSEYRLLSCRHCKKKTMHAPFDDSFFTYLWQCSCGRLLENKADKPNILFNRLIHNAPMTLEELLFLKDSAELGNVELDHWEGDLELRLNHQNKSTPREVSSFFISNISIDKKVIEHLVDDFGEHVSEDEILLQVFDVKYKGKTYYCCLSGGEQEKGGVISLSKIGDAALSALMKLPISNVGFKFVYLSLISGASIRKQIESTLDSLPEFTKVCFWGDLERELDGHILINFNVQDVYVKVEGHHYASSNNYIAM